jgi:predicted transposase YdaD
MNLTTDDFLKTLIDHFTLDFATWLLDRPIQSVTPQNVELPAQPKTFVDRLFLVTSPAQLPVSLHIEFQGRRSRTPVPARMLEYVTRLDQTYPNSLCSVVIYVGRWAGSNDEGHHQRTCPVTGQVTLEWRYRVIRLWQMPAEELLALDKIPLLALVGLTRIDKPAETIPYVLAKIRSVVDGTVRQQLLTILVSLTEEKEIVTMIEELLYPEEELLIDTPFLRRMREMGWREGHTEGQLKGRAEGRVEGRTEGQLQGEAHLLERQLHQRFGELPLWVKSRLQQAAAEQLERWSLRVLDAPRLELVFEE